LVLIFLFGEWHPTLHSWKIEKSPYLGRGWTDLDNTELRLSDPRSRK